MSYTFIFYYITILLSFIINILKKKRTYQMAYIKWIITNGVIDIKKRYIYTLTYVYKTQIFICENTHIYIIHMLVFSTFFL